MIMMAIEEHVMPMMMDAVVTVAAETNEASRMSLVETLFGRMEEQKKKLQYCFGSKLYPNDVHMAPQFPALTYGSASVTRGGSAVWAHGSYSHPNTAGHALIGAVGAAPPYAGASTSSAGKAHHTGAAGADSIVAPQCVLPPYAESDEEVALHEDDIAFCLRSMFASPAVPESSN